MTIHNQESAEVKGRVVYVRAVTVAELPADVREKVDEQLGETEVIYSVNNQDGERIALVADRQQAFYLARANDFAPVSVH